MFEMLMAAGIGVDAAETGVRVYDRWKAAEAERQARVRRTETIVTVGAGLAFLGAAAATYLAENYEESRLTRTYFFGYTDVDGRAEFERYHDTVTQSRVEVARQRTARSNRRMGGAVAVPLAVAGIVAGAVLGWVAVIWCAVAALIIALCVLAANRGDVESPIFPPAPVVFPSAPRKSAAVALLGEAERKRGTLGQIAERLAVRDPLACYLLLEAKNAAEVEIEEAAVNHELIRWDIVDSGGKPDQSRDCADAQVALRDAVTRYGELVPLAQRASSRSGRAAVESLAKRAGLEAALDAGQW